MIPVYIAQYLVTCMPRDLYISIPHGGARGAVSLIRITGTMVQVTVIVEASAGPDTDVFRTARRHQRVYVIACTYKKHGDRLFIG